jgi:hypothetical protein
VLAWCRQEGYLSILNSSLLNRAILNGLSRIAAAHLEGGFSRIFYLFGGFRGF